MPLTGEHKEIGNLILMHWNWLYFKGTTKNLKLIIRDTKADPQKLKVFKEFLE